MKSTNIWVYLRYWAVSNGKFMFHFRFRYFHVAFAVDLGIRTTFDTNNWYHFFDSYPVMYRRAYLCVYFLNPSPTFTNSTNNTKLHNRYRYSSSTVKLAHPVLAKYDWIIIVFNLVRGHYYYLRVGVEIRPRVNV